MSSLEARASTVRFGRGALRGVLTFSAGRVTVFGAGATWVLVSGSIVALVSGSLRSAASSGSLAGVRWPSLEQAKARSAKLYMKGRRLIAPPGCAKLATSKSLADSRVEGCGMAHEKSTDPGTCYIGVP